MTLKVLLSSELKQIYPDMKDYLADRYASKYVSAVLAEIKYSLLRPENELEELSFSGLSMRDACGQVKYNNKTTYLFEFMGRSHRTSLVIETFAGNQGKMKRVKLNEIYKEQIMYELMETPPAQLTEQDRAELEANYNRVIPIDIASLQGYITRTRDDIAIQQHGSPLHNKLTENYFQATRLLSQVEQSDGVDFIKEYWVTADTGREYGKFLSLQRVDKNVRHAALGVCHKYDFQAHSFAVMASIARSINPAIKIGAVEEYVKYRSSIRKRIAHEVGVPEDVIKTVFTSLGFGARPRANPYNAIRRAFYTDELYNKFITNDTFKYIREDLETINSTVLGYFTDENFTGFGGYNFTGRDPVTRRKKSDSKRLAWIYQNAESVITREFTRIVEEYTGEKPLMTVHDCAYYKRRIPIETFVDVQVILKREHGFEFVKLEHEAIFPITTQAVFDTRFAEQAQHEQEHQQRIAQEESRARGYKSQWAQPLATPQPQINPFARPTNESDLPDYEYELEDYR